LNGKLTAVLYIFSFNYDIILIIILCFIRIFSPFEIQPCGRKIHENMETAFYPLDDAVYGAVTDAAVDCIGSGRCSSCISRPD
jgi:hypothetical protein